MVSREQLAALGVDLDDLRIVVDACLYEWPPNDPIYVVAARLDELIGRR